MKAGCGGRREIHHVRKWGQMNSMSSFIKSEKKIPIVYYLCRNGQLQHPHFMEVPVDSSRLVLLLRDVINRMNFLRGKGMAAMYSWSSKRSYKNGFVWQDLSDKDIIHPINGDEYVLKGSEIVEISASSRRGESVLKDLTESNTIGSYSGSIRRGKNQWSLNSGNYIVCKNSNGGCVGTQTDEVIHGKRRSEVEDDWNTAAMGGDESPSPEYSPEKTAEANGGGSGRIKVTAVLRQLILCGSLPTMKNTNQP